MEWSLAFEQDIHQRLLAGDPVAPAEAAAAYLEPLANWLRHRFRTVHDDHLIFDAATDALLDYLQHPTRFDPARSRLLSYLRMAARRDLLNALQKEGRRRQRQQRTQQTLRNEPVELHGSGGNDTQEGAAGMHELGQHLFESITDARDRQILRLLLDGERQTARYAEILGIQDRDRMEQCRLVKRHKDRLKKRLARLGAKLHGRTASS